MDDAPLAASSPARRWRSGLDLTWLAAAIAVLPIVIHVVRYLVDGAAPVGDAAYFTVRSVDVGTRHHPLLGAWSSGSAALAEPVNNLGPLQLDLLAPFTKVAPLAGTLVGAAVLNTFAIVGVAVAVRRVAGRALAVVALATVSLVTWALGSVLLVDARQQYALMLPFACLLFLCWAVVAGDRALAPFAVFAGSLLVQTHLSYVFPVVAVGVATVAAVVVAWWRDRRAGDRPARSFTGPLAISMITFAVCWVQPLLDQFWGHGNMRALFEAAGEGKPGPGLGRGLTLVATVVTDPAAWGRVGFVRFDPAFRPLGEARAAVGLALVVVVLGAIAVLAWRGANRPLAAAVTIAFAALVGGVIAAARLPPAAFGIIAANYRWLWPLVAFVLFTVAVGLVDIAPRFSPTMRRVAGVAGGAVLVALALAGLPRSNQLWTVQDRRREAVTAELLDQVHAATLTGPVVFDRSQERFTSPYAYPVMAALQERDVEFVFDRSAYVDVARFGDERRAEAVTAPRFRLITGSPALETFDGEIIALVRTLSVEQEERRRMLTAWIVSELRGGRFQLADLPDGFVDRRYPAVAALDEGGRPSAGRLVADAASLIRADALVLSAVPTADVDDWLRLEEEAADSVVLVLEPPPDQ